MSIHCRTDIKRKISIQERSVTETMLNLLDSYRQTMEYHLPLGRTIDYTPTSPPKLLSCKGWKNTCDGVTQSESTSLLYIQIDVDLFKIHPARHSMEKERKTARVGKLNVYDSSNIKNILRLNLFAFGMITFLQNTAVKELVKIDKTPLVSADQVNGRKMDNGKSLTFIVKDLGLFLPEDD
ncbi:hypothetical protein WN51_08768 [Melipona quadrifasciata]|uniref:Uncharacterized protein n=1 Tax=Melipona quadrifasciata TaxID=166423 RepID=A0A0M8ZMV5_9HYME|nr:hypothetical protein WN51_08768 [Melipona quadrifasciata]